MIIQSFDSETALFRPGTMAPELACLTHQAFTGGVRTPPGITHHTDATAWLAPRLADTTVIFTGAHTAFDTCVAIAHEPDLALPIFDAYDADRITDVQIREKILNIAAGRHQGFMNPKGVWTKPKYSLSDLCHKYRGAHLDKPAKVKGPGGKMIDDPEHVRLRFGELRPFPLNQWDAIAAARGFHGPPPTAYALDDAGTTLDIHLLQEVHADPWLKDQWRLARVFFALQLQSVWGLRTNPERVKLLQQRTEAARDEIKGRLLEAGLVRPDGSRDTKVAKARMIEICATLGRPVPLTETGGVALDADSCELTGDPILEDYAAFTTLGFTLSKDVVALTKGTAFPIHTRWDLAATSRITSSSPNVMNWGTAPGPRECFEARPGWVLADNDYPSLELFTLAESCIQLVGRSSLADALNSGLDPHTAMAAKILGITYEEASKNKKRPDVYNARQTGKVFNFGKPGGLGAKSLVEYARALYGVILTEKEARDYGDTWLQQWPEMSDYFAHVNRLTQNPTKLASFRVPNTDFFRGGATYCAACNTNFQALGAHCATRAIWLIARECYVDRKSPLYGARPVCFVHDQQITEVRDDVGAHDAAVRQADLMIEGARPYLPNVPIKKTDPTLMRWWSKDAFALKRAGKLVPWAGEWECEQCNTIQIAPAPIKGIKKVCANHTGAWS